MTEGQNIEDEKNRSTYYPDSYIQIADELEKLDLLIQRRVASFRQKLEAVQQIVPARSVYIPHEEVDWLLHERTTFSGRSAGSDVIDRQLELLQKKTDAKVRESMNRGIFLALPRFARLFNLSAFELQTVLICLAPELDRKYDKLYAYLQDDITRKKPSIDLVLDLLCDTPAEQWRSRAFFSDSALLFRAGILHKSDDPQSPSGSSGLAQFLQLDPRILGYIMGDNRMDKRLHDLVEILQPLPSFEPVLIDPAIKTRIMQFANEYFTSDGSERKRAVIFLQGPPGVGKKELARAVCGQLNCPLVRLDMELLPADDADKERIFKLAFREGLLLQGALYIDTTDVLLNDDRCTKMLAKKLAQANREYGWLTFLAGEKPWPHARVFDETVFLSMDIPIPDVPLRTIAWKNTLGSLTTGDDPAWAGQLADRFRLTPGQIRDAAKFAGKQYTFAGNGQDVTLPDLFRACRTESNQKLREMALKIDPRYDWNDIVLPEDKLMQLKEICSQVRHRYRVFGEWGFGRKLSHGKGLSVLFTGPSGTGKTMAAEVIAHELKLDLYKIDLSGIISKYIGETEKNLSKVFQEAETSNAILFFDEADAIFGKRTEVSDAHDRYANIETSYLLQKMEEYEGMVILATNLRDNMDEAFTRRIRFIIEFPFPDETSRSKIWRTHFPGESPVSDQVDYDFLASQYQVAGGNIKNIVLNAAFLAAESDSAIGMEHLIHSTKREFEKIGKLWNEHIPDTSSITKK